MSGPTAATVQIALAQMLSIRSQGAAADHDPVLRNMHARSLASLERIAPGASEKVRAFFEDMKARDIDPRTVLL